MATQARVISTGQPVTMSQPVATMGMPATGGVRQARVITSSPAVSQSIAGTRTVVTGAVG